MIKKIINKINDFYQNQANALNTLLTIINIFVIPIILIWCKSFYFSLFVCFIIGFSNYKILKEAYLKNDKILKGDINIINKIMSLSVLFGYILLMLSINLHPLIWIATGLLILFEINIIGEYYNLEEIKKLK